MKTMGKLLWQTGKVFILFAAFTTLFYFALVWFNEEYDNYHKYDKPEGSSMKVYQSIEEEKTGWKERLLYFYINGE